MLSAVRYRLLGVAILSIYFTAHADFGPSIWQQLQTQGDRVVTAKIEALDVHTQLVRVAFAETGENHARGRLELCQDEGSAPAHREAFVTALHQQRLEILREALRTGEEVQLSIKGPWSPCLSSIAALRNPSKG
ncbi:MAG: hypothetical protein AB7F86_08020 [Bdellovibrionales bacterium]